MLNDKERAQLEALTKKAAAGEGDAVGKFLDDLGGADVFQAKIVEIQAACAPGSAVAQQMSNLGVVFNALCQQYALVHPAAPEGGAEG